jgi:uncharacterized protein YbcC (UPF0753/DUF2309 family)
VKQTYSDTQRMALRSQVKLASEVVAPYWPMRTFIHHNPLHELESLPFDQAVRRGHDLLGGRGYLTNAQYRHYYRQGRIRLEHMDAALRTRADARTVRISHREVTHLEVLRAHLLHGFNAPADENLEALCDHAAERDVLIALMARLRDVLTPPSVEERSKAIVHGDLAALGQTVSLPAWCDRTLGTGLVGRINGEMTRWCSAFLDEGQAAWPMPHREQTLYGLWKTLGQLDWTAAQWGIRGWRRKVDNLADRPDDAILDALLALGIPDTARMEYLALQLAALPGWTAFIKWRGEQQGYVWQRAYPADLVKYLAIRLCYERELVGQVCPKELGIEGSFVAIRTYIESHPLAYFLRLERVSGRLPVHWSHRVDRLRHRGNHDIDAWEALASQYLTDSAERYRQATLRAAAWRLLTLANALDLAPAVLLETAPASLRSVLDWLDAFPETQHGPVWLEAFEGVYQQSLCAQIQARMRRPTAAASSQPDTDVRPQAQAVFCIDVRSEPVRRHLEAIGNYDTFGFAGFFICFIRYRTLGSHHETDQFPVIMKARNLVREIPRSYHGDMLSRHRAGARFLRAAHTLLHDLKENVITPYVMVESLGWFYSLPFFGKSVFPVWSANLSAWLKRVITPPVATTLTVDKVSKSEAEEMVASEQCATIRKALRERLGLHGSRISPDFVEALRRRALNGQESTETFKNGSLRPTNLSPEKVAAFVEDLRRHYRIDPRWASGDKERITRTGFTLEEQIFTVETALRMMGLTRNLARLVLFCAHGSTSENNPFESALDCGACGGNEGKPNARLLAAMANKPQVRERLAKNGLPIPPDTHFVSGQIDTTTDEVQLLDLEDVPATHRKDLVRLIEDLREAGRLTTQERCARLPDVAAVLPPDVAVSHARRRSSDWSQVRPEWGLSGNTAFIIARREITRVMNLEGRVFLHSYDYVEDSTGRLLEILMTAPQVVTQWINMEHYFSTVDNEVYGSGSKIYHNVVGRIGIMSGTQSDLRSGLAWQTVMNGDVPYHEPLRLMTLIEAPRTRITQLIQRHEMLQRFYRNGWVHLVALEREEGTLYRYLPTGEWHEIASTEKELTP